MAENNNYMEFVKQSDLDFLDQTAIEAELFQNEPSIQNVTNETNVSTEAIEIHDVLDTEEEDQDQDQEDDSDQGADPDADSGADPDADTEADTGGDPDPDPDPVVDPAVETDRYGNRYDDSDPVTDSDEDADTDEDADPGAVTDMEQHQYVFDTVRGAQYSVQGTSDGRIKMFTLDRDENQTDPVLANGTDTDKPNAVAAVESANKLSTQARVLANRIQAAIASRYRYQTKQRYNKEDPGSEGVNEVNAVNGVNEELATENAQEEDLSGHVEAAIAARYKPESESNSESGKTFDEMNEELACLLERMRNLSRVNGRFREFFFDDDVMSENWPRNMRPRVRIEQYEQCYSKIVEMDIQDWEFPDPDNFQRMIYRGPDVPRIFRSEKRIRSTLMNEEPASDDTNSEITHEELNEMERQVDENRQHAFRDPSTSTSSSSSDEDEVEVIEMVEMPGNSVSATIDAEANPGLGIAEETPAEKSSEEAHNSEREMANISAWENRSASQKRYHAQKHYQEVRERGRRNRRLILRCMRYPGGQPTVVIDRLPKQIREMAHLYPGFNPNAGRDRDEDEDNSEDVSDPPQK